MTRLLEKDSTTLIHLKKGDLKWIKSKEEIFIDGDFFDIKEIRENGGELLITGIFDKTETLLQKKADDLGRQKGSIQDVIIIKYLQLLFNIFSDSIKHDLKIPVSDPESYTVNTSLHADDILLKVPSPPPKA